MVANVTTISVTLTTGQGAHRDIELLIHVPTKAAGTSTTLSTIFYSHGATTDISDMANHLNAQLLAERGYIVIQPQHLDEGAVDVTSPYHRTKALSTIERIADFGDLTSNVADLMAMLNAAMGTGGPTYIADLTTPTIAGHSQGAFTAGLLVGMETARPEFAGITANPFFKAAILISPQGVPTTAMSGEGAAYTPYGQSRAAATAFYNRDANDSDGDYWTGLFVETDANGDIVDTSWDNITVPVLTLTGTDDSGDAGQTYIHRKHSFEFSQGDGKHAGVIFNADHIEMGGGILLGGLLQPTYVQYAVRDMSVDFLKAYVQNDATALAALNNAEQYSTDHPDIREVFQRAGPAESGTGYLKGTSAANTMEGSSTADRIFGEAGNDTLKGNRGNDYIHGGTGLDTIDGGKGNDTIIGGDNVDTMTGGKGDDVFAFLLASDTGILSTTRDKILDFDDSGNDFIDLSALAGTYTYMGTGAFTAANQVRVTTSGSHVLVHVNTDADVAAEMVIELSNTTLSQVDATDFIL